MAAEAERLCRLAYDRYSTVDFDGMLELFAEEDQGEDPVALGLHASYELSLWQEGQCRRYFVYWDEEQGRRAFDDCASRRLA